MLEKIISGGQSGSDEGGLRAAKRFGIATGGMTPKDFRTENGPNSDLKTVYGLVESKSDKYPPRTFDNAKNSDGTIRFAINFGTPGEQLTLKAINQYKRPYIDVDVANPIKHMEVVDWIVANNIVTLNVAGNAESKYKGMRDFVDNYLFQVLTLLKGR
jgi:Circularly permutated YpsA SLOG family